MYNKLTFSCKFSNVLFNEKELITELIPISNISKLDVIMVN